MNKGLVVRDLLLCVFFEFLVEGFLVEGALLGLHPLELALLFSKLHPDLGNLAHPVVVGLAPLCEVEVDVSQNVKGISGSLRVDKILLRGASPI